VAKNDVIAYMWARLAAASGVEAKKVREILEKKMTAPQIGKAQRLSKDWKP